MRGDREMRSFAVQRVSALSEVDREHRSLIEHVMMRIKRANPGGMFARITWWMALLLPERIVRIILRKMRYDGNLFLDEEGRPAMDVFWQRHGDALHMFAVWIRGDLRKQGLLQHVIRHFLEYARRQPGISGARLSAGGVEATGERGGEKAVVAAWLSIERGDFGTPWVSAYRPLKLDEHGLPVEQLGWVRFAPIDAPLPPRMPDILEAELQPAA